MLIKDVHDFMSTETVFWPQENMPPAGAFHYTKHIHLLYVYSE